MIVLVQVVSLRWENCSLLIVGVVVALTKCITVTSADIFGVLVIYMF